MGTHVMLVHGAILFAAVGLSTVDAFAEQEVCHIALGNTESRRVDFGDRTTRPVHNGLQQDTCAEQLKALLVARGFISAVPSCDVP